MSEKILVTGPFGQVGT